MSVGIGGDVEPERTMLDTSQAVDNSPSDSLARPAGPPGGCSSAWGWSWYPACKRSADLIFAIALLILFSPIIALAALLVKLSSRGPAFYLQVRVGQNGRTFVLFKLRTMRHLAEAATGPAWSTENDPRVTQVGWFLRRTHIDEFPQLLNVALGQMSLVGPRPERPEFVDKLACQIPGYHYRLKVRPGITGLAQLRLGPDSNIDCVRHKVVYDAYYVRHVNPLLDLKLLCLTAWRLVSDMGRYSWRWTILPSLAESGRDCHIAAEQRSGNAAQPAGKLIPNPSDAAPVARHRAVELHLYRSHANDLTVRLLRVTITVSLLLGVCSSNFLVESMEFSTLTAGWALFLIALVTWGATSEGVSDVGRFGRIGNAHGTSS